jgi:hypothetical protein
MFTNYNSNNSKKLSPSETDSNSASEFPNILNEPEGLFLWLQDPFTGPYPEPDQSSFYNLHSIYLTYILILSSNPRLGLLSGIFVL